MSTFHSAITRGSKILARHDDDNFDRVSSRYSIGVLFLMLGLVSVFAYSSNPISCYVPKEFPPQWIKYADNYCWVSNTYYLPDDEWQMAEPANKKDVSGETYRMELSYYQWVPIILVSLSIPFALPGFIWSWASTSGEYDVAAIVKATKVATNINPSVRDKTLSYLTKQICRTIAVRQPPNKGLVAEFRNKHTSPRLGSRGQGRFLCIVYTLVKVLYLANAVGQMFLLNIVLGYGYHNYGLEVISRLRDPLFVGSPRFPYVTMCDLDVRRIGNNLHRYTIQCLMPVNLINEKIFIAYWFWLMVVAIISALGLVVWLFHARQSAAVQYVYKQIVTATGMMVDKKDVKEFVEDYLRPDGVLCMRLVARNSGNTVGCELVGALWDYYLQTQKQVG